MTPENERIAFEQGARAQKEDTLADLISLRDEIQAEEDLAPTISQKAICKAAKAAICRAIHTSAGKKPVPYPSRGG